jgi:site-specific recombinase XerD
MRHRTNRKDRWYLPKTHKYYWLGYCFEKYQRVQLYLPSGIKKSIRMPWALKNKDLALELLEDEIDKLVNYEPSTAKTIAQLINDFKNDFYYNFTKANIHKHNQAFSHLLKNKKLKLDNIKGIRSHVQDNVQNSELHNNTIRKHLQSVRQLFDYAVEENYIATNPIPRRMLPNNKYSDPVLFTEAELFEIIEYFKESEMALLVKFVMITGVRIAEAIALTADDIHDDHILIHGKGNRLRKFPINPFPELRPLLRELKSNNGFSWKNQQNPQRILKKAKTDLGIHKDASFHSIRKYAENKMINRGYNINAVAQLIGHTTKVQSAHYIAQLEVEELESSLISRSK